jgi:hypothetical protein
MLSSYSSGTSSLARLLLRPRIGGGGPGSDDTLLFRPAFGVPSLKTCIVMVADETASSDETELKDMLNILAGIEPRRNWYNFCPSGTVKTRMMVPFSEAVASKLPSLFSAMHDKGELCASITFTASNFVASYIRTSPLEGDI